MASDSSLRFAKIIDLGLAGKVNSTPLGGTPLYNSPEKINNTCKTHQKPNDVWALALTIIAIEARRDYVMQAMDTDCFEKNFSPSCYKTLIHKSGTILN